MTFSHHTRIFGTLVAILVQAVLGTGTVCAQTEASPAPDTTAAVDPTTLPVPPPVPAALPAASPEPASEPAPERLPSAPVALPEMGSTTPESSSSECREGWLADVLERSKRAAVWVETPFNGLAGVLVSPRRIVTHTAGIDVGRGPLRVRFADDQVLSASVVEVDTLASIAVLELAASVQFAPLEVGDPAQLRVGAPLLVIAQPITKFSDAKAEFDRFLPVLGHKGGSVEDQFGVAAPYELGARGAPVIGCDGRWYGSVVQLGSTMVVQKASALTARATQGSAEGYSGGWGLGASRVGVVMDLEAERGLLGLGFGFSLLGYDTIELRADYGILGVTSSRIPVISGARVFADLSLGYRVLLAGQPAWYLVPAIGAGGNSDGFEELMQPVDPGCRGPDCALEPRPRLTNEAHGGGYYFGKLALLTQSMELSFALRFAGEQGTSGHITIAFGQL